MCILLLSSSHPNPIFNYNHSRPTTNLISSLATSIDSRRPSFHRPVRAKSLCGGLPDASVLQLRLVRSRRQLSTRRLNAASPSANSILIVFSNSNSLALSLSLFRLSGASPSLHLIRCICEKGAGSCHDTCFAERRRIRSGRHRGGSG